LSRLVILGVAVFSLVILGLAVVRAELLLMAIPLAVYLLSSLYFSPWQPKLEVSRQVSATRVVSGTLVEVRLSIFNLGESIDRIWLEEKLPGGLVLVEGETRLLDSLPSRQSLELNYTVRAERGVYALPVVEVYYSDRLGLVTRRLSYETQDTISVLPKTLRLAHLPIRPPLTHGFNGSIPARRGGPGVLFFGLRDYQPGDALRWVNWRASARQENTLVTNEFQQESAANVGLILDARQESYLSVGQESLFEHAASAAASLAEAFLNAGNRVGLVHYGRYISWTLPGYGKVQRERILNALAQAAPGESQIDRLEYLPARFVPPGSQLVLVSPLLERDLPTLLQLRARRYAVLVISPDPVAFEAKRLPNTQEAHQAIRIARLERQLVLQPLREAGIQLMDWDVSIPFDQAIQAITRGAGRFWAGGL